MGIGTCRWEGTCMYIHHDEPTSLVMDMMINNYIQYLKKNHLLKII